MAGEINTKGSGINAELILDCGATSHMFCDCHFFTSYTPTSTPESISVGDHHDIPVAGHGTIRFQARLLDGYCSITLHSALHVPKLAANLISLGTLQRQGVGFSSYQNGIVIKLGEEELSVYRSLINQTPCTMLRLPKCKLSLPMLPPVGVFVYGTVALAILVWTQSGECTGRTWWKACPSTRSTNMIIFARGVPSANHIDFNS